MSRKDPEFQPTNRMADYFGNLNLPATPEYDWLDAALADMGTELKMVVAKLAQERVMQRQRDGELGDLYVAQGGIITHRKIQK